jgi:hypothetical protein
MSLLVLGLVAGLAWANPEDGEDSGTDGWETEEGGIPTELMDIARESSELPLGQRMREISQPLKGKLYEIDPIGEETGPDPDPVTRYDVFDCLTFVEEVLALGLPMDPVFAPEIRKSLRYGPSGEIAYENRNHFMMHQWIPNNIANGLLVDISTELGATVKMTKTVHLRTWTRWNSRSRFMLRDEQLPVGEFSLDILPLDQALLSLPSIPPGALILTVRENRSYVPIVVTHIGFVVASDDPERPLLRHATKMGSQPRVRDDFLQWYFEHLQNYKYWKVAGVVVLMPQELDHR